MNEDSIDMSILDMIPYTEHSPTNHPIDTPDIFLEDFDSTPFINTQKDLSETPKNTNGNILNSDINQSESELYIDEMFEEVKFKKLKTMILNQIKIDIKTLIKNEFHKKKSTLTQTSNDEVYKKEISMLRDELKTKDYMIKDLLNTIKEVKTKPAMTIKPILSYIFDASDSKTTILPVEESDNITENVKEKAPNTVSNEENRINIRKSIEEQLSEVIKEKQERYYQQKIANSATNETQQNNKENTSKEKQGKYPSDTTVVLGDSILNGVIQEKLSRPGRPLKVHNFRDATLDDMKYHVIPIIRKEPSFAILHIGANDAAHTTSKEILDQILELKALIIKELPTCRVVISTPTVRSDDAKAALTVSQLTNKLLELNIETVDNRNINHRNLGQKGLHLNQSGTSRFAKNIFNIIKGF